MVVKCHLSATKTSIAAYGEKTETLELNILEFPPRRLGEMDSGRLY